MTRTVRRHGPPLAALLTLGLLGVAPLFHPGFPASHDGHHQIVRLMHFHRGLVDGQLPVRWAGTALCGYGYPLFVFTYRLPFWLAELWYLASGSLGDAIKATFVVTFLASGVTMYWLAHLLTASRLAAFGAAALYLWAPYRFLDVYVRGALGEATTFVFVPLVYGSIHQMAHDGERRALWSFVLAASAAGLVLSHTMIIALFGVPVAAWWVLALWTAADRRPFVLASVRAGVVTLLLTAYYWLPASLEKRYTLLAARLGDSWADHFVAPMQLVRATWGFSFDVPGLPNRMSFQLGLAQWVVLAGGLALAGMLLGRRERSGRVPVLVVLLGTAAASLYGTLPASAWFYRLLQHAVVIDLPWSASRSPSSVLPRRSPSASPTWGHRGRCGTASWRSCSGSRCGAIASTSPSPHGRTSRTPTGGGAPRPAATTTSTRRRRSSRAPARPKTPSWSRWPATPRAACSPADRTRCPSRAPCGPTARWCRPVAWYPGWQLFVDGRRSALAHRHGRVVASVPHGEHVVSLAWRETGWRLVGDCASLIGLLYVVATGLHAARRPRA